MEPFQPPSKLWIGFITPFAVASCLWTMKYAVLLMDTPPTSALKWKLILGVMGMCLSGCWIAGVRYLQWAAAKKTELAQLLRINPRLLYIKYDRVFLNSRQFKRLGRDPVEFKGLQQRDIREVINISNLNQACPRSKSTKENQ